MAVRSLTETPASLPSTANPVVHGPVSPSSVSPSPVSPGSVAPRPVANAPTRPADLLGARVVRSIDRLGFPGAAQSVRCQAADGRVVLEGQVDSYYLKQVCQTIAAKVPGVRRVENRLVVAAN